MNIKKILCCSILVLNATILAQAATMLRQATITPGNDTGTLLYHMSSSVSKIEFKLSEGGVNATLRPSSLEWSIGANTIEDIDCNGSVTYSVTNPNTLSPDKLFINKIRGIYSVCGGDGDEGTNEPNRYQYNLAGSTGNSVYVFPSYSEIAVGEWINLTAKKNSDHSNVAVKWFVDNDGNLYRSENIDDKISANERLESVKFRSSETGDFKISIRYAVDTNITEYIHGEVKVLGKVSIDPIPVGNKRDLPPGLVCKNVENMYKKAKWKVAVEDNDDQVRVYIESGDVHFEDENAKYITLSKLNREFFVYARSDSETGDYTLKAVHSDGRTTAYGTGKIFEFWLDMSELTPTRESVNLGVDFGDLYDNYFEDAEEVGDQLTLDYKSAVYLKTRPNVDVKGWVIVDYDIIFNAGVIANLEGAGNNPGVVGDFIDSTEYDVFLKVVGSIPDVYAKTAAAAGKWMAICIDLFGDDSSLSHSAVTIGKSCSQFGVIGTTAEDESITIQFSSDEIGPHKIRDCKNCPAAWALHMQSVLPEADVDNDVARKKHIDSGTVFLAQDQSEEMNPAELLIGFGFTFATTGEYMHRETEILLANSHYRLYYAGIDYTESKVRLTEFDLENVEFWLTEDRGGEAQ